MGIKIDFDKLKPSRTPSVPNEELFYSYPGLYKKDKKSRKIKVAEIEELMKTHLYLNPFIIKQNDHLFGHFEVKCKPYTNDKNEITGYGELSHFTRVYKSKSNLITVSFLSPKGKALFLWILFTISSNKGMVKLNEKRILKMKGLKSINSLNEAIEELDTSAILKVYIHPYYWINPRFLFLGNRAYAFQKHRKASSKKADIKEILDNNPDEIF